MRCIESGRETTVPNVRINSQTRILSMNTIQTNGVCLEKEKNKKSYLSSSG